MNPNWTLATFPKLKAPPREKTETASERRRRVKQYYDPKSLITTEVFGYGLQDVAKREFNTWQKRVKPDENITR